MQTNCGAKRTTHRLSLLFKCQCLSLGSSLKEPHIVTSRVSPQVFFVSAAFNLRHSDHRLTFLDS